MEKNTRVHGRHQGRQRKAVPFPAFWDLINYFFNDFEEKRIKIVYPKEFKISKHQEKEKKWRFFIREDFDPLPSRNTFFLQIVY